MHAPARSFLTVLAWVVMPACATAPAIVPPATQERLLGRVLLEGQDGSAEASLGDVVFSPTGTRVAYVVWLEVPPTEGTPGGPIGTYAVIDGQPGPLLRGLSPPVFSADGKHFAYSGMEGQTSVLILDGELHRPGKIVYPPMLGGGGRWAYVVSNRFGDRMAMVVNGEAGPWFEYVWPQGFTPDGRNVVYKARHRGKHFLVVGGERSRLLDEVGFATFARQGASLAYRGCQGGRCFVFVRGRDPQELPPGAEHVTLSSDLRRIAYRVQETGGVRWVVDGRELEPFDDGGPGGAFVFSPAGESFAYPAWKAGKGLLVRDGAVLATHDEIGAIVFSPDGKRLAYSARDGAAWRIVVDGQPQAAFGGVGEPVFSPDGCTVIHSAHEPGGTFLVREGRRHGPFTAIHTPITFTADGANIVFGARVGLDLWWKVIPVLHRCGSRSQGAGGDGAYRDPHRGRGRSPPANPFPRAGS